MFFGDNGVIDFDAVIRSQKANVQSFSALRNFETGNGLASEPGSVRMGEAAVDVLVGLNGFPALANFYRGIGTGATWQEAFESAFGRTIDEFYVEFEELRDSDFALTDPADLDDVDSDGVLNENDNCRFVANSEQTDTDSDDIGDVCDTDDDNDGVPDTTDAFPLDATESVDTDGDGMGDVFENRFGLDPDVPDDADLDGDADGITNLEEFRARTNPNVNEAAVLQIINSILSE
jgi:hypothetical protein